MQKIPLPLSNKIANMSLLCSLMVICIHVLKRTQAPGSFAWRCRQLSGEGLCRIAVPFFFAAAGYFLAMHFCEKGWYKREVLKRIRTLAVPFVVWCSICFMLCSCIMVLANLSNGQIWHEGLFSLNRIVRSLGVNPVAVPELRQLWFVRVLFVLVLVSPILRFVERKLDKIFWGGVFVQFCGQFGLWGNSFSQDMCLMRFRNFSILAFFLLKE